MSFESHRRWHDYSRAEDAMFAATDTDRAPWHAVDRNSKRRARLNCISHLLNTIPFEDVPTSIVKLLKWQEPSGYVPTDHNYRYVPECD